MGSRRLGVAAYSRVAVCARQRARSAGNELNDAVCSLLIGRVVVHAHACQIHIHAEGGAAARGRAHILANVQLVLDAALHLGLGVGRKGKVGAVEVEERERTDGQQVQCPVQRAVRSGRWREAAYLKVGRAEGHLDGARRVLGEMRVRREQLDAESERGITRGKARVDVVDGILVQCRERGRHVDDDSNIIELQHSIDVNWRCIVWRGRA